MLRKLGLVMALVAVGCSSTTEERGRAEQPLGGLINNGIAFMHSDGSGAWGNLTTSGYQNLGGATLTGGVLLAAGGQTGDPIATNNGEFLTYHNFGFSYSVRLHAIQSDGQVLPGVVDLPAYPNATDFVFLNATLWLFYDRNSRTGAIYRYTNNDGRLSPSGQAIHQWTNIGDFGDWTNITGYGWPDSALFYNSATNSVWRGRFTSGAPWGTSAQLDNSHTRAGFTSVAFTRYNWGHVFYDAVNGETRLVQWDPSSDAYLNSTTLPSPGTGYTHVVGTRSGKVLFYKKGAGTGRVLDVATQTFMTPYDQTGFDGTWGPIVAVDSMGYY